MIKVYFMLFFLFLAACGGGSVSKPTVLTHADSYNAEAMQAFSNEEWRKAQGLFTRALKHYLSIDDRIGELNSYINLVEVALADHNNQMAQHNLMLAEAIVKMDDLAQYHQRITLLNALLAIKQRKIDKANHFLSVLLPEFNGAEVINIPTVIQLVAISSQTKLAFEQKEGESLWTLRYAHALTKSANQNVTFEARLLRFQAKLAVQKTEYKNAEAYLQQALLIYKAKGVRTGIAGTLSALGGLNKKQGKGSQALNYFNRAIIVYRSLGAKSKVNELMSRQVGQ
jgi:tetratricopeptide (TPR) repeat protein